MWSISRTFAPRALRGKTSLSFWFATIIEAMKIDLNLPATTTLPPSFLIRTLPAINTASISTSRTSSATTSPTTAILPTADASHLPITGGLRREVPLPSQEPKKGAMQYALTTLDQIAKLGPPGLPLAHDLRPRLLRRRDDALVHTPLRPGPAGYNFSCLAETERRDDCCGNADE